MNDRNTSNRTYKVIDLFICIAGISVALSGAGFAVVVRQSGHAAAAVLIGAVAIAAGASVFVLRRVVHERLQGGPGEEQSGVVVAHEFNPGFVINGRAELVLVVRCVGKNGRIRVRRINSGAADAGVYPVGAELRFRQSGAGTVITGVYKRGERE